MYCPIVNRFGDRAAQIDPSYPIITYLRVHSAQVSAIYVQRFGLCIIQAEEFYTGHRLELTFLTHLF